MRASAAGQVSAGLLMVRRCEGDLELLLVHPGGPFFAKKDDGAWTLPKGLVGEDEPLLDAARREFVEETGFVVPAEGPFVPLGSMVQKSGKTVHGWAFEGDCDPAAIKSNTFSMEWPPRSGKHRRFPEADRAAFFRPDEARRKIIAAQSAFIDRAVEAFARPR